MAISTTTNTVLLAGNSSTVVFPYQFPFYNTTDLQVYLYDTIGGGIIKQTLGTNYSVAATADSTGIYPNGGNVLFTSSVISSQIVVIDRQPIETQTFAILQGGFISSVGLVHQLDYLTLLIQDMQDRISRSVALPTGFGATFNTQLPSYVASNTGAFAGCFLQINSTATGIGIANSSFIPFTPAPSGFVLAGNGPGAFPSFQPALLSASGAVTLNAPVTNGVTYAISGNTLGTTNPGPAGLPLVSNQSSGPSFQTINYSVVGSGAIPTSLGGTGSVVVPPSWAIAVGSSGGIGYINPVSPNQALVAAASSAPTWLSYATSATNSTLVQRDTAGNSVFNNAVNAGTQTISASGTVIAMTAGSTGRQSIVGSSAITFKLPSALSSNVGTDYFFLNDSSGKVTIFKNDGTTLVGTVAQNECAYLNLLTNNDANGTWDLRWLMPSNANTSTCILPAANGGTGTNSSYGGYLVMGGHNVTTNVNSATLSLQLATSQVGNVFEILNTAGNPSLNFDANGFFRVQVSSGVLTPEARVDMRPVRNVSAINKGSGAVYSIFIGDNTTAEASGVGGGIALGGPQDAIGTATEFAYLWATKANSVAGDVGAYFHIATRNNGTGLAQRAIDIDDRGFVTQYGNMVWTGATTGTLTHTVQSTVTSYSLLWPSAVSAVSNGVLTSDTNGNLSWATAGTTLSISSKTAAYNSVNTDQVIIANSGCPFITLASTPAAGTNLVVKYGIQVYTGNFVTINGSGGINVADGYNVGSSTTICTPGEAVKFAYDGTNWQVLERNIANQTGSSVPTTAGLGAATANAQYSYRDRDQLVAQGALSVGTGPNSSQVQISLMYQGVAVTVDTTKISASTMAGNWLLGVNGGNYYAALAPSANQSYFNIGSGNAGSNPGVALSGSGNFAAAQSVQYSVRLPILGWKG